MNSGDRSAAVSAANLRIRLGYDRLLPQVAGAPCMQRCAPTEIAVGSGRAYWRARGSRQIGPVASWAFLKRRSELSTPRHPKLCTAAPMPSLPILPLVRPMSTSFRLPGRPCCGRKPSATSPLASTVSAKSPSASAKCPSPPERGLGDIRPRRPRARAPADSRPWRS